MTAVELALKVVRKLKALGDQREALNSAYGDDRGAYYEGGMEPDLKELAIQVLKEYKGG